MFSDDSAWNMSNKLNNTMNHSAECLRKAVPLMVKYNIAVTPPNYALWYTFVSGKLPALNEKLNAALKAYGTCPPALSRELFEQFLSEKDLELYDDIANELSSLIGNVNQDIHYTLEQTMGFSEVLTSCNSSLDEAKESETLTDLVLEMVNKLSDEAKAMQHTTSLFQTKLALAHTEISRLRAELKQTKQDATHDALTGLLNRGSFDDDITQLCSNTKSNSSLFLTFVDIDNFKQFNDDFGHQKGDQVLKIVAKMLHNKCDQLNIAYRFGGEEFCIISQNSSQQICFDFVESLRVAIERLSVKDSKTGANLRKISASFGIARHQQHDSPAELIEKADQALYLAKQSGRNRVEIFCAEHEKH
ncbi:GGDEF domain-containing protein [Pseudoalteromonas tunicata]|uniref:GGDEF domain-containing protein n=1 Tax=Pseudoalteromonas tunicata TaxID=314281 RepID=UPI00273D1918|nr:diguanylate cyclase [Pseudoalteromonas tunicata]MDP4985593.1 diguanylate cyclase [Pseudoalteromonas tunicata]